MMHAEETAEFLTGLPKFKRKKENAILTPKRAA
jgi:hypothetical protein